ISSAVALFPFKMMFALTASLCLVLQLLSGSFRDYFNQHLLGSALCVLGALGLMAFESEAVGWLKNSRLAPRGKRRRGEVPREGLEPIRLDTGQTLGVVYMSGDDLSFYKLSAEVLMTRVRVLREKLGSRGLGLLSHLHGFPDDSLLTQWFQSLYEL